MSREFPDFLSAYAEYAQDSFCPDEFHYWTGVSIVSAALERKVWAVSTRETHFPNLFVMLIAVPGEGKSTAAQRGIEVLLNVQHPAGPILYIPPKITDAAFHEIMRKSKTFFVGTQGYEQTPGFYFANEASNALKEIKGGDSIFPIMTEAYDCKELMSKATVARGVETIVRPCMNVLACSTFDALKGMLTETGIMGGFASRFLYVVHDQPLIRRPKWDEAQQDRRLDPRFAQLVGDLQEIHHLTGQFTTTPGFREAFETWFPKNDEARHKKGTEKEQAVLARKHSSVIKLSMIYCVSEGNDMLIKERHWEKALRTVNQLGEKYERILDVTRDARTQDGVFEIIRSTVARANAKGGITQRAFHLRMQQKGIAPAVLTASIAYMINSSKELETVILKGEPGFRLTTQP